MSEFVFCVDSDGTVMDTMTYKHELFFGPIAADQFEIKDKKIFQKNWEDINLYSKTRGINRFTGLVKTLESVNYDGMNIKNLKKWVYESSSLSNESLEKEIENKDSKDLKYALVWSNLVNEKLSKAEGHDEPFEGALVSLNKMANLGKVHIVSSANRQAIEEEWTRHGLIEYVNDLYCQESGQKKDVINRLIKEGTDPANILMIGDASGDIEAAKENNTWFYPILVGKEKESWENLYNNVLDKLISGNFTKKEEQEYEKSFWLNLDS